MSVKPIIELKEGFSPNLQKSSMHSSILGKTLQFRVAASTIRTVEKKGGLDEFLLNRVTHILLKKHKS